MTKHTNVSVGSSLILLG